MKGKSFCVFILSHGRPGHQKTINTLKRQGYTGDWKIIVDDEDATVPEYIERYGEDRVVVFNKLEAARTTDPGDNFPGRGTVLYARNACFDIARDLGYDYFLQLDDDYGDFMFREEKDNTLVGYSCRNLNDVFATMLDFLDDTGADAVALAQGGDYIGGMENVRWKDKILRKAMNTFFIRTDADLRFVARLNDDVSTYVVLSQRGTIFFTTMYCMVIQTQTQASTGGLTTEYLDKGTYVKSFYSVMMCPSAVDIHMMGVSHVRVHHHIRWRNVAPKILPERYRKER